MHQGLATWQDIKAAIVQPYWLALLAEGYGQIGQTEKGLSLLAEGLTLVENTEERSHEAGLYRLKGELTLQQSSVQSLASSVKTSPKSKVPRRRSTKTNPQALTFNPQVEAEVCFHKAIEIAKHQQAKSLELRAVLSLARLWQRQGKRQQAQRMLAEVYGWFTEGFDTADLKDAKIMLAELSR
jgi:hypothetical protein